MPMATFKPFWILLKLVGCAIGGSAGELSSSTSSSSSSRWRGRSKEKRYLGEGELLPLLGDDFRVEHLGGENRVGEGDEEVEDLDEGVGRLLLGLGVLALGHLEHEQRNEVLVEQPLVGDLRIDQPEERFDDVLVVDVPHELGHDAVLLLEVGDQLLGVALEEQLDDPREVGAAEGIHFGRYVQEIEELVEHVVVVDHRLLEDVRLDGLVGKMSEPGAARF